MVGIAQDEEIIHLAPRKTQKKKTGERESGQIFLQEALMKQSRLLLGSCLLPLLLELSKPARVIIKQKKKKKYRVCFFFVESKRKLFEAYINRASFATCSSAQSQTRSVIHLPADTFFTADVILHL
jgi:hypothetical protein